MRAGPVILAVRGWRDGFVVGETHVLPAYQGQGLGSSLITALLHPAPDATCAVLCKARKPCWTVVHDPEVKRGHDARAHPGIVRQDRVTLAAVRCLLPAVLVVRLASRGRVHRGCGENRRCDMAKPDAVFIYIGTYPSEAAARADYDVVKDLHAVGAVGTYDAGVVTKDDAGKVHVNKDEMATRHGAWAGAAVGALVGILFPPAIIASTAVGAAVGGVGGHLWRGMSRADVRELGDIIDDGQAALVIVGESKVEQAVDKAALKAGKHVAKELDVKPKDIDKAVREAATEVS